VITLTLILPNLMEEHNVLRDVIAAIATIGVKPAVVLLSFSRRSCGSFVRHAPRMNTHC
jgi:hypothetical protein